MKKLSWMILVLALILETAWIVKLKNTGSRDKAVIEHIYVSSHLSKERLECTLTSTNNDIYVEESSFRILGINAYDQDGGCVYTWGPTQTTTFGNVEKMQQLTPLLPAAHHSFPLEGVADPRIFEQSSGTFDVSFNFNLYIKDRTGKPIHLESAPGGFTTGKLSW